MRGGKKNATNCDLRNSALTSILKDVLNDANCCKQPLARSYIVGSNRLHGAKFEVVNITKRTLARRDAFIYDLLLHDFPPG